MCDKIIMPDGTEIESIKPDDVCLCDSSQSEILSWIVQHVKDIYIDENINIEHDPFGYVVTIDRTKTAYEKMEYWANEVIKKFASNVGLKRKNSLTVLAQHFGEYETCCLELADEDDKHGEFKGHM